MINSETTLEEFIQYIPVLNKSCHLQQVVSAIYSSSQRMIALVDDDGLPQGIIYSYLLLNLIREQLLSDRDGFNAATISLQEASIALTALSHKTKIQEFFDYFLIDYQAQKLDYWIVDENTRLLGILNIPKLLQVLCFEQSLQQNQQEHSSATATIFKSHQPSSTDNMLFRNSIVAKTTLNSNLKQSQATNSTITKQATFHGQYKTKLLPSNRFLSSLLKQLNFPLKIEDIEGNIYYQNQHWHQKIAVRKVSSNKLAAAKDLKNNELNVVSESQKPKNSQFKLNRTIPKTASSTNTDKKSQYNCCPTVTLYTNGLLACDRLQQQIKLFDASISCDIANNKSLEVEQSISDNWYYYKIPLEISNQEIKISNAPNYWLTFATQFALEKEFDLNELNLQKQLKLKQLRDEFIFNISHDMKSPLTAIIGLSSLLKEEKIGILNKNQIRYNQMIYNSGKKLIDLINDFLNITRLTTEEFTINLESIDIENTFQEIYRRVSQKKVEIANNRQKEQFSALPLHLNIDPEAQFAIADKQVFSHIITCFLENALELAAFQSTIEIKTEYWSNWLAITVSNQGGGFSQTQQNSLFSSSFQATKLLTSPNKIRELGLVLAQQLARDHGGDISLISQNNYGTQFTLLLPPYSDCSLIPSSTKASSNNCDLSNSLILIVETSPAIIFDLNKKLNSLGYRCAIARNQTEALYKANLLQPQKIIVNSSFAESISHNTVKALKDNPTTSSIPIVLLTDINSIDPQQTKTDNFLSLESYDANATSTLIEESLIFPCSKTTLAKLFTSLIPASSSLKRNLTVLRLSLEKNRTLSFDNFALDWVFQDHSFSLAHHIVEADSIEQANLLAKIWNFDVIIWDGATLNSSQKHFELFAELDTLARIPIITLDTESTEAANNISNLKVFPCLLPANERSIDQLTQVIQIAADFV